MGDFGNLFVNILIFVLLMLPGYLMGKCRRIEKEAIKTLGNLLSDVAMPALVFLKLLETDFSKIKKFDLFCAALLPIVTVSAVSAISALIFKKQNDIGRREVSRFCAAYSNCGFLGIPLAGAMFPDRPEITVYVSIFNIVSTFMLLTLGTETLSGEKEHINPRKLLLRPLNAVMLIGVILSLFGIGQRLPALIEYSSFLAQLTTPLSMTVLGYQLANLKPEKSYFFPYGVLSLFLKLIASPLLMLSALFLLDLLPFCDIGFEIAIAMCIATAVSSAASAPAMAAQYGLDEGYAAALTVGGTLLCAVTLPTVYCLYSLVF